MSTVLHASCFKATRLVERGSRAPLGIADRLSLFVHLRICTVCRAYQRHSSAIDRLMGQRDADTSAVDASQLEQAVLRRISESR